MQPFLCKNYFLMEFHVSRQARDSYQFEEALFSTNGNVILADFQAARRFAQKMNEKRDLRTHPELGVRAGQINAMGLIDEILHQVVEQYRKQRNPQVMGQALEWLVGSLGESALNDTLLQFTEQFPPLIVQKGKLSAVEYLAKSSMRASGEVVSNREIALEEMILLWLANLNPAFHPFIELFDDNPLVEETVYSEVFPVLRSFFEAQPTFGPGSQNLIDVLRAPALAHPNSLSAQLEYMRTRWSEFISIIIMRLLSSLDFIREEEKPVFGVGGEGPALVYEFTGAEYELEPERFSPDLDWMPNLVLIAKNTYVWLDQLSRKYQRAINRLDQVPDVELKILAESGITGLWLIGLWERSPASKRIKIMRGNQEAVASAYSLFGYDIAADLGGEEAYRVLREQAWRYGVRLASDMVPNHMGIDSRWVIENPDWFIQLPYSPFPSYSFNGPNLSWDERVGLFLEDHYYDNSDAAVVFKRVDFLTGDTRYFYHGNDGTSMPWNDTAQLNYLMPEVREAVIQTILHVARKFPVIRFDAAMTLAKRHFQRLWFPEPGSGGDIPSRAEYGMNKARFDQAFPEEFWRMVVDRVAQEAPDTLLLAEAFWLMEGYFVRTLGMHRVYNSAFMNMLRDEKNQEYRLAIKNTVEFEPEILKRYVNFMNNPDERTAIDQFGKGDKYFGICTMLATLPGLPMFGHGQIEGFAEKYGMEFRYPKWHEEPDTYLVERHQRQIFPLLRRRYQFANSQHFRLYDFYLPEGYVNEDVFAYSNRAGDQRALVVYQNRYAETSGWLHLSAAFPVKTGSGEEKSLIQSTLGEELGLHDDSRYYTIFRDYLTQQEYLRNSQELVQRGLYLELNAYRCFVFMDFREVMDDETRRFAQLAASLEGRGVPNIDEALTEMLLGSVLFPFRELVNPGMLNWCIQNRVGAETYEPLNYQAALKEVETKLSQLLSAIKEKTEGEGDPESLSQEVGQELHELMSIALLDQNLPGRRGRDINQGLGYLINGLAQSQGLSSGDPYVWGTLLSYLFTSRLGKIAEVEGFADLSSKWMDEWTLGKIIANAMEGMGLGPQLSKLSVDLMRVLMLNQGWLEAEVQAEGLSQKLLESWLKDEVCRQYLSIHPYEDVLWFNKEAYEELVWWTFATEVIRLKAAFTSEPEKFWAHFERCYKVTRSLLEAEEASGYQVEPLLSYGKGESTELTTH